MFRILNILSITVLLVACTTSPTGRKQIAFYSDDKLAVMGATAFAEMKTKIPLSSSQHTKRYVNCITNSLLTSMGENPGQWEVLVFADQKLNAFALPGKKIGVYEGIMRAATNQHMLAAVLGHEIGHVNARHSNERLSAGTATNLSLKGLEVIGGMFGYNNPGIYKAIGLGAEFGIVKPYGRKHESEADLIGLQIMSRAGFNPVQSITLWQNMGKLAGREPLEFLSTHPSNKTRINDLHSALPGVLPLYQSVKNKPNCTL